MGFLSKYPYTDFHELNLDKFIEILKTLNADVDTLKIRVPKPPTNAGTYNLKCTVDSSGKPKFFWGV